MTTAPHKRRGVSFRVKLAAGISALALGIVIALGVILTEVHVGTLERELHRKGEMYTRLLAGELHRVIDRGDAQPIRDALAARATDEDVETVALYGADRKLIQSHGAADPFLPGVRDARTFQAAITSPAGVRATAVIHLGTRRVVADRKHYINTSLLVAAVTAGVAFVLAWFFARSVTRRLERISAAASLVAEGNLDQPSIDPGADDEIGSVAIAFNAMVADLRALFQERQDVAATEQVRLTELVAARTAQLVDSREQYRLIAETTNAIPFTYVPDADRFSYIGPQCARILDYAPAAMRAPGFLAKLVDASALAAVQARLADPSEGGFELELPVVSGAKQQLHVRMIATRDTGRDGACVRGLLLDMTQHRQLEQELAHAHKLESVGRLAAGIAHEINTPAQFVADNVGFIRDSVTDVIAVLEQLRGLRASADPDAVAVVDEAIETADLDYLCAEIPKGLDAALNGLTRITTIVHAMREFAHPAKREHDPADLNHALQSTLTVARNEYRYVADVDLQLGEIPPVHCDVNAFNQAVLNIVVNAAHAIGEVADGVVIRGRITVTSEVDGDGIHVSIADTGNGIPSHVRDRIFDPFFTTKEVGKGTGQGLAIARAAIVEKHGGSLTFDTELGRGTTFHIRLPVGAPVVQVAA